MEIKTKYDVGQNVYIVCSGGFSGFYSIETMQIKSINIGKKAFDKYSFGTTKRSEREIFVDKEEAKNKAKLLIKKHYNRNIELIDEAVLPDL